MDNAENKLREYLGYMGVSVKEETPFEELECMVSLCRGENVDSGYMTENALKNRRWEHDKYVQNYGLFEDEFLEQYTDELRKYVRSRVKGCSDKLTKDKIENVLKALGRIKPKWWTRNEYKIVFWDELKAMYPGCCDGNLSEKLEWDRSYWTDVDSDDRRDLLAPTQKQSAMLKYFDVNIPVWANRGDASAFIRILIGDSSLEAKRNRWQFDRFRLHPEIYAHEIELAKFEYADSFYRFVRKRVKGAAGRLTEEKLLCVLETMDARNPGWFFSITMENPDLEDRNHNSMFDILREKHPECIYPKGSPFLPPKPTLNQKGSKHPKSKTNGDALAINIDETTLGCLILLLVVVLLAVFS